MSAFAFANIIAAAARIPGSRKASGAPRAARRAALAGHEAARRAMLLLI
jgi:hypothetical protein